jgi:hypothetical protein
MMPFVGNSCTLGERGGSGFLDGSDEWSFCLTAARMAAA